MSKTLPIKGREIRELTATQENTLLFQLLLLLPCCSATILTRPSLPLLILNDFFKCELVSLRRCHIPRCKSELNPRIRFPRAVCTDIVRMESCRELVLCRLPCKPEPCTVTIYNFDLVVVNHLAVR